MSDTRRSTRMENNKGNDFVILKISCNFAYDKQDAYFLVLRGKAVTVLTSLFSLSLL